MFITLSLSRAVDDSESAKLPLFEQEKLVWTNTLNVFETIVAPYLFQHLLHFGDFDSQLLDVSPFIECV